jgi:probable HAF family extracellular repeat protein
MSHAHAIRLKPILATALFTAGVMQAHAAGYLVTDMGRTSLPPTSPCSGCTQTNEFRAVGLSDTGIVLGQKYTIVIYRYGGNSSPPLPVAIDAATQQNVPIAFPSSTAFSLAINQNNQVALSDGNGTSYVADLVGNRILPAPPGYAKNSVKAINASGQTSGSAWNTSLTEEQGYIAAADGSSFKVLGLNVRPKAMNAKGQVAGTTNSSTGSGVAFKTNFAGMVVKLGKLWGDQSSEATGINDSGVVVGYSTSSAGVSRAFVTNVLGLLVNLNNRAPSGYTANQAVGINNAGPSGTAGSR